MSTSDRVLLCEGASGAFIPATAYCRQGDKVWFAYGATKTVSESVTGAVIVESIDAMELEERQLPDGRKVKMPKNGVWVVEGPAQASDQRNGNNRYYPEAIWKKWISDPKSPAQQAIRERAMVGHLEHPADGRTDGNKLGLVVTNAELKEDGVVYARFELLDTPEGQRLQEYTRKGVKWGVSSRGTGSVDEKGRVSPDDYVLETWDAVMRPSVSTAIPRLIQSESSETPERGSAKETVAKVTESSLPDSVAQRATAVESLCETVIDELDETGRSDLRRNIMESVMELVVEGAADTRVSRVLASAFTKLAALDAAGLIGIDDLIESALSNTDADEEDSTSKPTDWQETVQALRVSHATTAHEAEELRSKLEDAESAIKDANRQILELSGQLAEADRQREAVASRLRVAEALLADGTTREARGPVQEAVIEAVRQVPQLDEFRSVLERAEDADEVYDLAERLLPAAVRTHSNAATPLQESENVIVENSRPTLPRGAVRSESDAGRITESRSEPTSRGALLAAAAASSRRS